MGVGLLGGNGYLQSAQVINESHLELFHRGPWEKYPPGSWNFQNDAAAAAALSNQTVACRIMKDGKCANKDPGSASKRKKPKPISGFASPAECFLASAATLLSTNNTLYNTATNLGRD